MKPVFWSALSKYKNCRMELWNFWICRTSFRRISCIYQSLVIPAFVFSYPSVSFSAKRKVSKERLFPLNEFAFLLVSETAFIMIIDYTVTCKTGDNRSISFFRVALVWFNSFFYSSLFFTLSFFFIYFFYLWWLRSVKLQEDNMIYTLRLRGSTWETWIHLASRIPV